MRLFLATIYKEFLQLVRNRTLLFLITGAPVLLLTIIPMAFDGDVRIRAGVCKISYNETIRDVEKRIAASPFFEKLVYYSSIEEAESDMKKGELDMFLVIKDKEANLVLDGTFPRRVSGSIYAVATEVFGIETTGVNFHTLYNAGRSYRNYYLVSLVVLIVTIISAALITLNIVNEKESGLEEQFRATIINRKIYFSGKFTFHILLSLFVSIYSYLFCFIVYDLRSEGSLLLLLLATLLYSLPVLGLGAFIGSKSQTQLRAVYVLTVILVLLIMLSTMFSHHDSMPEWAAASRFINPVWYGIESARIIILKGI